MTIITCTTVLAIAIMLCLALCVTTTVAMTIGTATVHCLHVAVCPITLGFLTDVVDTTITTIKCTMALRHYSDHLSA